VAVKARHSRVLSKSARYDNRNVTDTNETLGHFNTAGVFKMLVVGKELGHVGGARRANFD
jgi:hypothetical protein